jgi:hypothetical protein
MMVGGRPKDTVWDYYNRLFDKNGRQVGVECKDCKLKVSAKADRMRAHRDKKHSPPVSASADCTLSGNKVRFMYRPVYACIIS